MKKLITLFLLLPLLSFGQEVKHGHVQLGAGFSFGGFSPSGINEYMSDYIVDNGYSLTDGSSELVLNLGGRMFLGYKSKIGLGAEAFLEGQSAPKVTNFFSYSYNRLSQGVKLTYDIRASRIFSIILGAGPSFSRMKLSIDGEKIYSTNAVGGKFGIAFQFNLKHIAPRVFIDFDKINGSVTDPVTFRKIDMSYTGVQFGLAFSGLFY